MLGWQEIESRAVEFQKTWKNCEGDEKQQAQQFEMDFMRIFGVDFRTGLHEYQIQLNDGSYGYIDYFLPGKIVIEMKSKGKSLAKAYTQAMSYIHALKPDEKPVLLMVCDFDKIEVYNLVKDHRYKTFKVSQIKQHVRIFGLLAGYGQTEDVKTEIELNTDASYKMAKLHDELKKYNYTGHNLEVFLVRLLFCLFADDTGIFEKDSFQKYVEDSKPDGSDLSMRIMELFYILDTPRENRMTNISAELNKFRYINGKLFSEKLPPAAFDAKMRSILLECCDFNWNQISPSIFGAMFQGVMNPQQRREMGAHYTSEENIMKVIQPLFLDDLYDEFEKAKNTKAEMQAFHEKIAKLRFLDSACGSGNFLLLAYQKLRELEAQVIEYLYRGSDGFQISLFGNITKVSIEQFYGIEYEEFPCEIARVSMFLMKHLLDQEIGSKFGLNIIDFPIKENPNIVHVNALRLDWLEICGGRVDYIMGNPPFVGGMYANEEQKQDIKNILGHIKGFGELDYACCWYYKAKELIYKYPKVKCALVSTNSICQGQQVITFWKNMLQENRVYINFAYQTFKWMNEARHNAAVHCIIVGFSGEIHSQCKLVDSNGFEKKVENISPYLTATSTIFIESVSNPISFKSKMSFGSMPRDGGHFILTDEERNNIIEKYPQAQEWIRPYIGAKEMINRTNRWVIWLVGISPVEIRKVPPIIERIDKVREFRLASKAAATRKFADTASIFCQIAQPEEGHYIVVPRVSSEKRKYIPIAYENYKIIASDALFIIPNGTLLDFSILVSNVHMEWMRTVAGRLEMRYRYAKDIVYNTFPIPELDEKTKEKLTKTAQGILDARNLYPTATYADLYDPNFMPIELLKAHRANDKAVWEAYGKAWDITSEADCVAYLMKLYEEMTATV